MERYTPIAQVLVFMPGQHDDDQIDDRHDQQPDRMGEGKPIYLIGNEEIERYQRCGVVP